MKHFLLSIALVIVFHHNRKWLGHLGSLLSTVKRSKPTESCLAFKGQARSVWTSSCWGSPVHSQYRPPRAAEGAPGAYRSWPGLCFWRWVIWDKSPNPCECLYSHLRNEDPISFQNYCRNGLRQAKGWTGTYQLPSGTLVMATCMSTWVSHRAHGFS